MEATRPVSLAAPAVIASPRERPQRPLLPELRGRDEGTGEPPSHADEREHRWAGPVGLLCRVCLLLYAFAILGFAWLLKDVTFRALLRNPLVAGYSLTVVVCTLSRYLLAHLYRPVPDRGHRPTVSIVIPAYNEQVVIARTIESCVGQDYPGDLLEVIVVNDGSSDATWQRILEAKARHPALHAVDLGANYGKRGAVAEGIRRSSGEIICLVDSDSQLKPDAVRAIVQPFVDRRVGAVVGHADVANRMTNWLTKMQQVRYYPAFRVFKGAESVLGGAVTCASGCLAAYRRDAVVPFLREWEFQTFLGRPATFGDDRALTNHVLREHRVVYQETAQVETVVPETMRLFLRQQLRWKKSWLRESARLCVHIWRKSPLAALLAYASVGFPLVAPFVVLYAFWGALVGGTAGLWSYLIGTYAFALLYSLYYAFKRSSGIWYHGISFVGVYVAILVFQTYWALVRVRDGRWGTRPSTVRPRPIDQARVTASRSASGAVSVRPAAAQA